MAEGWLRVQGQRDLPGGVGALAGRAQPGQRARGPDGGAGGGGLAGPGGETLRRFPGVEHRLETAARSVGVLFVNDSQATTPVAPSSRWRRSTSGWC